MVVGRKIWERMDMMEATDAARRERKRMGEATMARGRDISPSSMFLTFCGPSACHNDQAGTQTHAINSCDGLSISAAAPRCPKAISTYRCWFSSSDPQLPLDPQVVYNLFATIILGE